MAPPNGGRGGKDGARGKKGYDGGKDGGKEGKGRGRGKGRGKGKGRGGHEEVEEEDQTPKVTRYTKMELLAISQLPASKAKPVDLDPLVDKENKESALLVRIANARFGNAGEDDEGAAVARRERRERRHRERDEDRDREDDERRGRKEDGDSSKPAAPNEAKEPAREEQVTNTASAGAEEMEAARAASKWLKADSDKGFQASAATTPAALLPASATAGTAAAATALSQSYQSSLLSQQALGGANLHAQAQAMQAAMAMSMVAAGRGGAGAYAGLNPYGAYNPYLFPYNTAGAYGGYPDTLDYSSFSQAGALGLGSSLESQTKLAAQAQAAASMYGFSNTAAQGLSSQTWNTASTTASAASKATTPSLLSTVNAKAPTSPLEASTLGGSTLGGSTLGTSTLGSLGADAGTAPEGGDGAAKGPGEEEEGCTQS